MRKRLLALGVLAALPLLTGRAGLAGEDKKSDEMADNPRFKAWANFKPGATVTQREETKYNNPATAKLVPGGIEKRDVTYKLVSINKNKAVVETVVVDYNFLSTVQSAPTRTTYPAKVKADYVEEIHEKGHLKRGKAETQLLGKTISVNTLEGSTKSADGEVRTRKLWYTLDVPGAVVREESSTSNKDGVVSTSTITVLKYAVGPTKKPKPRE
jgi:hypothetical protein